MTKTYLQLTLMIITTVFYLGVGPIMAQEKPEAYQAHPRSIELNEQGTKAAKAGDTKRAEKLLREAVTADSKNVTAVYNLAGIYMARKNEKAAVSLLEEYTSRYPEDLSLRFRLGDALFSSKDPKAAASNYEHVYKQDPDYPGVASRLATIYGLMNRTADTEKMLRKALELDPQNGTLLTNLSSVLLANKKPDEAIARAKQALQITGSKDLYITLGLAYEMQKDAKNALIAFRRAEDLGVESPGLEEKIARLKKAVN